MKSTYNYPAKYLLIILPVGSLKIIHYNKDVK